MTRLQERLIDFFALCALLVFAWVFRESQPILAGVVTAAGVQFWMTKNAHGGDAPRDPPPPHS